MFFGGLQEKKQAREAQEAPKSQNMKKRNKRERGAEAKAAGQRFYKRMKADAEYTGSYFMEFQQWIGNEAKKSGAGDNDAGGGGDSDESVE